MPNCNKVFLMGNLTKDPELRYTPGGAAVCNFNMAINREWLQNGEKKKDVCFVRVTVWGKSGEASSEYLRKGNPVFIEGRLQSRSWDKEGGGKGYSLDVVAERVQFLSHEKKQEGEPAKEDSGEPEQNPGGDIPF